MLYIISITPILLIRRLRRVNLLIKVLAVEQIEAKKAKSKGKYSISVFRMAFLISLIAAYALKAVYTAK